jgi:hypothetical protein
MPPWLLIALQLAGVAAVVTGIALVYIPAAWIVGGLLVLLLGESPGVRKLFKS